jgi:hypothetical protein
MVSTFLLPIGVEEVVEDTDRRVVLSDKKLAAVFFMATFRLGGWPIWITFFSYN